VLHAYNKLKLTKGWSTKMGFVTMTSDQWLQPMHAGCPVSVCYRVQFTLCQVIDPGCYLGQSVIQASSDEISFAE